MKKILLGALLICALSGCGENKYLAVKDIKAPTHPNETPIKMELFCRKAIEVATPENDTLNPEDIKWNVVPSQVYDVTVVASYKDLYKVFINMNNNTVVNIDMMRGNTLTPINDVINSGKMQIVRKMVIPYSPTLIELSRELYLPMKTVDDAIYLLFTITNPTVRTIDKNMIAYRVIAQTNKGFIMRAAYGADYIDIEIEYNGDIMRYNTSSIIVYNHEAGYAQSLAEMDAQISLII